MKELKAEVKTKPKTPQKGTGQTINFSRNLTAKERVEKTKGNPVTQMSQAEKDQLLEDLRAALLE